MAAASSASIRWPAACSARQPTQVECHAPHTTLLSSSIALPSSTAHYPGSNETCLLEPPPCSLRLLPARRCWPRSISPINTGNPKTTAIPANVLTLTTTLFNTPPSLRAIKSDSDDSSPSFERMAPQPTLPCGKRCEETRRRRWPNVVLQTQRVLSANSFGVTYLWQWLVDVECA